MRPICEVTRHIWGLVTKENQSSAKLFSTISESQVHPIVLLMVVDATWWQQLGQLGIDGATWWVLATGDHLVILCQRPRWSRLAAGNLELSGNFGPLQPAVAP